MKNAGSINTEETATVAEQGADVAPETTAARKRASRKKGAPKAKKSAKPAPPKKEAKAAGRAKAPKGAKEERTNKRAEVITMLKRAKGATIEEIAEKTNWLRHTIRGFISLLGSRGGLVIVSSKNTEGERCYRIAK